MPKILQVRLQQYVNCELPDVEAGFRKRRGTRDHIANISWIIKKASKFQKTSVSALLTLPKPLTVWITTNSEKFFKRWEQLSTSLLRNLYADQEATELDMKQQIGSKLGKEYVKAIYCHPAYLTYIQSTS